MFNNPSDIIFVIMTLLSGMSLISIVYHYLILGIGPTPSSYIARLAITRLCEDLINAEHNDIRITIYELGAGWGGLTWQLKRVATNNSNRVKCMIAYESSAIPFYFMNVIDRILYSVNYKAHRSLNIKIIKQDATSALSHLDQNDILVCYLCPKQMTRLASVIKTQETKGFYLVSLVFALPHHEPNEIYTLQNLYNDKLYMYKL